MSSNLVIPGEEILVQDNYLRGHGTYIHQINRSSTQLLACVAGDVQRVDKLVSVQSMKIRYSGEVGDLIVGRISSVESKRWKVDINAQKDAILQLSSVNLPGGVQRMRTYEDQLQMRLLFTENDLISAEIQNVSSDGTASIHARSLKYGKLDNGQLICVPAALVRRLPQHYVSLPWGIDVILGKNGYIWITRTIPEAWKKELNMVEGVENNSKYSSIQADDDITPLAETLQELRRKHSETEMTDDERMKICRVRNAIYILSQVMIYISPETISSLYQISVDNLMHPKDMMKPESISFLVNSVFK